MTKSEYDKWRKNGNFTITQDRLLQVSNHIAEGEHGSYTKREAAQVATYWSLVASGIQSELSLLKTRIQMNKVTALFGRDLAHAIKVASTPKKR